MSNPAVLSVVIPAHNEADSIAPVLRALCAALEGESVPYEVVVVNDHSADGTEAVVASVGRDHPAVRCVENQNTGGFGFAVRAGLDAFRGDVVAIVMADGSDPPEDVVRCYREITRGFDCVFGSRFMRESRVVDYPRFKLGINRLANLFIQLLFRIPLNDTTNAFKLYRREAVDGLRPILSNHFNLTVELPLKAIVRACPSSSSGRWAAAICSSCCTCGWKSTWPRGTTSASADKVDDLDFRALFDHRIGVSGTPDDPEVVFDRDELRIDL
jgi:dolichol-phosphate mannosyltransferase